MEGWPVKASQIDFLFVSHAHIDHIGRIPELIRKGFKGEIITTHPTKALLLPMLRDAMGLSGLSEEEAGSVAKTTDDLSWGFEYGQAFDLKKGVRFTFHRAGHILGSSFLLLESGVPHWSILFSGDLGARNTPLLPDPDPPPSCDLLVLESTYGDRLHESRERRIEQLGRILTRARSDGGKVFIPAFALGRTQELLYELDRLFSDHSFRKQFPQLAERGRIPVVVDSPLGLELTKITSRLSEYWDREAKALLSHGDHPLDFDRLYASTSHKDHLKLLEDRGPVLVIAGGGMCAGGRIVNHLKAGIEDPRNDILFVGYNARGTPGREIQQSASTAGGHVTLDGGRYRVRAGVHTLGGYSAHADQKELMEWVGLMPGKPRMIKLVHGEPSAQKALANELSRRGYKNVLT
jgi:metallo-beta-lactamase family protein